MSNSKPPAAPAIVTLSDLTPRREVVGGCGRRVFGAVSPAIPGSATTTGSLKKIAPKVKPAKKR